MKKNQTNLKGIKVNFSCLRLNTVKREQTPLDSAEQYRYYSQSSIICGPQAVSICSHSGSSAVPLAKLLAASFINSILVCCQSEGLHHHRQSTPPLSAFALPCFVLSGFLVLYVYNLWLQIMCISYYRGSLYVCMCFCIIEKDVNIFQFLSKVTQKKRLVFVCCPSLLSCISHRSLFLYLSLIDMW